MDNYFERELMNIEREIRQLKTSQQKFAGQVPTTFQSISIRIPLRLNSSRTSASGQARYRITTVQNSFVVATLAKYYDNILVFSELPRKTRSMSLVIGKASANVYIVQILANGTEGANSDVATLINGGSVELENTLTVQSTDEFTVEILA